MSTPRACCHKGLYYEPIVAPDGTLAHAPHCKNVKAGEYIACAGCATLILEPSDVTFDKHGQFGELRWYCPKCDPLRMVDVRVPAALVEVVSVLWDKWKNRKKKP